MNHSTAPALRVALIGYGYVGQTMHAPLIRATPDLDLVLVGSSNHAKVQADLPGVAVNADYLAVAQAPGIDLVVIASPNDSHHPLAKAALLAGNAVVIDKPFTVTLAEATELVELAEARGLLLSVFHNRRWDGDFLTLAAALRGQGPGGIGPLRELISRFDRYEPLPRSRWRESDQPGAGLWYDLGPHLLDQALCLLGRPDSVSADLACLRPGNGSIDYAQVVLAYEQATALGPGPCRVTLHCSRLSALPAARFEAHGLHGSLACHGLDVQENQLKAGMRPDAPGWGTDPRPLQWQDWNSVATGLDPRTLPAAQQPAPVDLPRQPGRYGHYYRAIAAALRCQGPNPVPAREALQVMAIMLLAEQSARDGRRLAI